MPVYVRVGVSRRESVCAPAPGDARGHDGFREWRSLGFQFLICE
uniref:Uncharacterized protein n=1 Tax=Rhizophora mucronata TaxID=61149 RepID=A0A2P2PJD6_RHIMU